MPAPEGQLAVRCHHCWYGSALGVDRFIDLPLPLTASRPPQFFKILGVLGGVALAAYLLGRQEKPGKIQLTTAFALFILLFVFLKTPALTRMISAVLRDLNGQSTLLASALDVRWLGFSYIAFRLMHTLRDRQSGRLPPVSLAEYVVYVIFFPALSAGPIDRIERFIKDLRRPLALAGR
jgi:D-alanyl-lipoteichoic acid acyltransferase DltB (MBOAT superfamily)